MNIAQTVKRIVISIAVQYVVFFALGLAAIHVFGFDQPMNFAVGLSCGTSLSLAKVFMLRGDIEKSMHASKQSAMVSGSLHFLARNLLSVALLVLAALNKHLSVYGVILGLILLQTAAFTAKLRGVGHGVQQ
jgi:hypothetical protein